MPLALNPAATLLVLQIFGSEMPSSTKADIKEFMAHYHQEPFHQALGRQLVDRQAVATDGQGACDKVAYRSRLGGMLNFYYREAA